MANGPGDALMRWGAGLTVAGLLASIVAMLPLVFPSVTLPPAMWFLAMLTGVGLLLVLAGLWRSARARNRSVARATARLPGAPT